MTPVDELREAARLMRERAEVATPGPWTCWQDGMDERWEIGPDPDHRPVVVGTASGDDPETWIDDEPVAQHIASWHPAVAFAVADWLDRAAQDAENYLQPDLDGPQQALAVARAYLGTQP